jgi:AcrR family transcriptional regulator/DNA-binding CsgD family transcriptional regulator
MTSKVRATADSPSRCLVRKVPAGARSNPYPHRVTRGRPRTPILLTKPERASLTRMAAGDSAELERRARIILLSASGLPNNQIATELGVDETTVSKWRRRFLARRLEGIAPPPSPSHDARALGPQPVRSATTDNSLVARRRRAIVAAALELFRKKGYGATSVSEIAALADLPIGTLYRYITKKSDILYLLTLDLTPSLIDAIEEALVEDADVERRLRNGIRGYLYAIAQRRTHVKIMYWDTHWLEPAEQSVIKAEEERTRQLFEAVIEEGIAGRVFRPVNTLVAAENIILAGHAWAIKGFMFNGEIALDDYVEEQVDFLIGGLLPQPGSSRRGSSRSGRRGS